MATSYSVEQKELASNVMPSGAMTIRTLDDVEPSTRPVSLTSYALDFSLMAVVFAILIFLWTQ